MDADTCSCGGILGVEWAVQLASETHRRHDSETVKHSRGLSRLAADIGRQMGLSPDQVWLIELASEVHDIGKITIPHAILEKPTSLTSREFNIIKAHAQAGYEILSECPFPWPIAEIARQHHERLDGSGYPRGLRGGDILLEAQIVAVADIAESMLADRPYRRGLGLDVVLSHLCRLQGTQLNKEAVDVCIYLFRENNYILPSH